jgi:hypothetical protein
MERTTKHAMALLLLVGTMLLFAFQVYGTTGASATFNSTENGPPSSAAAFTNNRSTITTVVLDGAQQNPFWKAYVGPVTGGLTLDDADSNTIYDWTLTTIAGEVYSTRAASPDWSAVTCAAGATITTENTFNNMSQGQVDSINGTFNDTAHAAFVVGSSPIAIDSCPSQALFVNDARQAASSTADFQQILLEDNAGNLVYTSLINDNTNGFDNDLYDFQMIVAESNVKATPTTYYFYLELG